MRCLIKQFRRTWAVPQFEGNYTVSFISIVESKHRCIHLISFDFIIIYSEFQTRQPFSQCKTIFQFNHSSRCNSIRKGKGHRCLLNAVACVKRAQVHSIEIVVKLLCGFYLWMTSGVNPNRLFSNQPSVQLQFASCN